MHVLSAMLKFLTAYAHSAHLTPLFLHVQLGTGMGNPQMRERLSIYALVCPRVAYVFSEAGLLISLCSPCEDNVYAIWLLQSQSVHQLVSESQVAGQLVQRVRLESVTRQSAAHAPAGMQPCAWQRITLICVYVLGSACCAALQFVELLH